MEKEKFELLKFLKGTFFNKMFIAVCAWFYFAYTVLQNGQVDIVKITIIVIFGIVTVIWMLSCAWVKFIESGKLEISAKVGTDIKADVADIIKASTKKE